MLTRWGHGLHMQRQLRASVGGEGEDCPWASDTEEGEEFQVAEQK